MRNHVVSVPKDLEDHKKIVELFQTHNLCNPEASLEVLDSNTFGVSELELNNLKMFYNILLDAIYSDESYTGELYSCYKSLCDAQEEYYRNNPAIQSQFICSTSMDFVYKTDVYRMVFIRIVDCMYIRTVLRRVGVEEVSGEPIFENV